MSAPTKPASHKRQRLILRESNWNSRFNLSTIPKYDPFQDIHCNFHSGQNYLSSVSKKKVVYLPPGTLSRSRSKRRKHREGLGLPHSMNPLVLTRPANTDDLVKLWTVKAVPTEQQSAFLAVIESLTESHKTAVIAEELELVRKDKSLAQQVDRLVLNREDCISKLRAQAQLCESEGGVSPSSIDQITRTLFLTRDLTIQTVLAVQAWREYLYSLNPNNHRILKLPYIWEGENYVLKLRTDLNFLHESALSQLFEFSPRSDPFLMYPTHVHKLHKGQSRKLDLGVSPSVQAEINKCEQVLLLEVLNGKEVDRTFRRELNSDRKPSREAAGTISSSNEMGTASPEFPASEEILRPTTRGKEKQFKRIQAQRTQETPSALGLVDGTL